MTSVQPITPRIQSNWIQTNRQLTIHTPLGENALLLVGMRAHEALSELFEFTFNVVMQGPKPLAFDKLLGTEVTASMKLVSGQERHFSGVVNCIRQGGKTRALENREAIEFLNYTLTVVPKCWFLDKQVRSRIFQQQSVPEILKTVIQGGGVQVQMDGLSGDFKPRDYCVQYRESDLNFASRLMEEEGIFYFFKHTANGHEMVLANTPAQHPEISPALIYDDSAGGTRHENRIQVWTKSQQIRSGKSTLWDRCFEMPDKNLEAKKQTVESVQAGTVTHKLKLPSNQDLEIYDFPGDYAGRFDGIAPGGAPRPADLQNIFTDNARTVGIRMQEETASAIIMKGEGDCRQMAAGSKFTLDRHYSDNGAHVLTSVDHAAEQAIVPGALDQPFQYSNQFTAIPFAVPFRPERVSTVPFMHGAQTATVVGPAGEDIFTDKYGRIKVQFHWDREGKNDASSSCWMRVASFWAGKQWGGVHIPRVGQEVVVNFLEGNVNEPLVVGSVYNADQMPPYELPANKTQTGVKSRSTLNGCDANFNEFRFEDKKGSEQIYMHAEKDLLTEVEHDEARLVQHDRATTIINNDTKTVTAGNDATTVMLGNQAITVAVGNQATTIGGCQATTVGINHSVVAGVASETMAGASIMLQCGPSSIMMTPAGIMIQALMISIQADVCLEMKGMMTQVEGQCMLVEKGCMIKLN